jgi:hypothetical protein
MSKNYAEGLCTACGTEPCAEHAPTEPVRASWQTTVQDAIRLCREAGRGQSTISPDDAYHLANVIEDATHDGPHEYEADGVWYCGHCHQVKLPAAPAIEQATSG